MLSQYKVVMGTNMNESFVKRNMRSTMLQARDKFPVLGLTGPRQSGKTTLLKNSFPDYEYVSLEDPDVRQFAGSDPRGFLERYPRNVIIDEVQRVPELFSYLQTRVDALGEMGIYVLSGSQNFHLMSNITQTLAGRIALFKLLPFDFSELKSAGLLPQEFTELCIRGSYPAIYDRKIDPSAYYRNYLQTYIEKDVTALINIRDLRSFRTFLSVCATRSGRLLNLNAIANECNISQPTAQAWLSVLESSYIVFLLQPYYKNFNKRQIKSPKLYFYDTGLLCHLLRFKTSDALFKSRIKGNIFETLMVSEMMKNAFHHDLSRDYYFWRDSNGREIDLLFEDSDCISIFEIKAGKTINPSFFENMDLFETFVTPTAVQKTLIYGGNESQHRTKYEVQGWNNLG